MPTVKLGQHVVNYEEHGDGPSIVLIPGLRNSLAAVRPTALGLGSQYRTIIYDRYNCGASDICFDGDRSEHHLWADQLEGLLDKLNAWPVHLAGYSLGGNIAILLAGRRRADVRSLFLGWATGGAFPRERLAQELYGQFLERLDQGGMEAVMETDYFRQRIKDNARNEKILREMDPENFAAVMRRWWDYFLRPSKATPLADAEIEVTQPTLIVAGDDEIHLTETALELHRHIRGSKYLPPPIPKSEWMKFKRHEEIAEWRGRNVPPVYLRFLREIGA